MSQLEYYGVPNQKLPHQSGLHAWGVVLLVGGCISGAMALFTLLFIGAVAIGMLPNTTGQNTAVMLMGPLVYVVMAVLLICLGLGSMRGRRWVRPLIIIGCIISAAAGLAVLVPMIGGAIALANNPPQVSPATPGMGAGFQAMSMACGGVFVFLLVGVLPMIMLWFYGRSAVQTTLDQLDPKLNWTDRCPLPVLGWAIACLHLSSGICFIFLKGFYPFFNVVLEGMPQILIPMAMAIMLCAGAYLCYRQQMIGWVMTFSVTVILAASCITFAAAGDMPHYVDLLARHLPDGSKDMVRRMSSSTTMMLIPGLMYAAAAGYALWILKGFKQKPQPPIFL